MDNSPKIVRCGGRTLDISRPAIMGVLNITPDSFSDGGHFTDPVRAVEHALEMCEEGASILDIGGESSRPGAEEVPWERELDRVIPIIESVRNQVDVVISVDTAKPRVMREAVAAGADLVNDIMALRADDALETAASLDVGICLMHMQGTPRTMQADPSYDNVVLEVRDFLCERVAACTGAGVDPSRLMVDPGFGFGKTLEHNLELLRGMRTLGDIGPPVLAGLSRKSFVGRITGRDMGERVHGSVAFALAAVREGASIVRAHDVGATADALEVWYAVYGKGAASSSA